VCPRPAVPWPIVSIWAPVVAALGASGLTGALGFGTLWWQQRHAELAASSAKRIAAYEQLIAHSLSFSIRASTLRTAMQMRSGIGEGIDVATRLRRPLDPFEFHDWFAQGFTPINDAWSAIQILGSPRAVEAATSVVDACADLVGVATEPGSARGKLGTTLRGQAWTPGQQELFERATTHLIQAREAFVAVARWESGNRSDAPHVQLTERREADGHVAPPAERDDDSS
jgi:hypothetical protein